MICRITLDIGLFHAYVKTRTTCSHSLSSSHFVTHCFPFFFCELNIELSHTHKYILTYTRDAELVSFNHKYYRCRRCRRPRHTMTIKMMVLIIIMMMMIVATVKHCVNCAAWFRCIGSAHSNNIYVSVCFCFVSK